MFCQCVYVMCGDSDDGVIGWWLYVCVFKQKTAYEIQYGLVGSEMCIRDSVQAGVSKRRALAGDKSTFKAKEEYQMMTENPGLCLLYTSDAADERSSVDLGGRRIIKTKKQHKHRVGIRCTQKQNTHVTSL